MSLFKNVIKHNQNRFTKYINSLTGIQFEHYTGSLLKAIGFKHVIVTRPSGDYGIDVIGTFNHKRIGIQCKHIKESLDSYKEVGYKAVEEANTGKDFYKLDKAIVLTNAKFSKNAKYGAKRIGIELWNHNDLIKLNEYINHIYFKTSIKHNKHHNLKHKSIKKVLTQHERYLRCNKPALYIALKIAGGSKAKCLAWLLEHTNHNTDIIPYSQRTIAEKGSFSSYTLYYVLSKLKEHNLVKTGDGFIAVSPILLFHKNTKAFLIKLNNYNNMNKEPQSKFINIQYQN